jgi:hypothetical protein
LQREWDDGFAVNSQIPQYFAYQDMYAQGYIGQLKKNGQFRKYLQQVIPHKDTLNRMDLQLRPRKLQVASCNS